MITSPNQNLLAASYNKELFGLSRAKRLNPYERLCLKEQHSNQKPQMLQSRQVSARQVNCNFVPQARLQFLDCVKNQRTKGNPPPASAELVLDAEHLRPGSGHRAVLSNCHAQHPKQELAKFEELSHLICSSLSGSLQQKNLGQEVFECL